MTTQQITFDELENMMIDYGHVSNFSIIKEDDNLKSILNNGMVYAPSGGQIGLSNNEWAAEKAISFVRRNDLIKVVSPINHISGIYQIGYQ